MIIVDGLDNTGKTTLVNRLVKDLRLELAPKSPGPVSRNEMMVYMGPYLLDKFPWETQGIIFDRFPIITEFPYGYAVRGNVNFTPEDFYYTMGLLRLHKPIFVYCTRDIDRVMETFDEREQMEGVKGVTLEITKNYETLMSFFPFPVFIYNFDTDSTDTMYHTLCQVIRKKLEVVYK